jgi:hypothetical protein
MRVPILQEIKIPERHPHAIEKLLKQHHIGLQPLYWVSDIPFAEELYGLLDLLEECFRQMHVDSHFPYAFYIVTNLIEKHSFFPIVTSVNQLPLHFKQKSKRPKAKEQVIAQKIEILTHLVQAGDLTDRREGLKLIGKKSRALYRSSREHAMLHELLEKMMENAHKEK